VLPQGRHGVARADDLEPVLAGFASRRHGLCEQPVRDVIVAGGQHGPGVPAHEPERGQPALAAGAPPVVVWPGQGIAQHERDEVDVQGRVVLEERQHLGNVARAEPVDDRRSDAWMQGHAWTDESRGPVRVPHLERYRGRGSRAA
jgi:hypothetical protein